MLAGFVQAYPFLSLMLSLIPYPLILSNLLQMAETGWHLQLVNGSVVGARIPKPFPPSLFRAFRPYE